MAGDGEDAPSRFDRFTDSVTSWRVTREGTWALQIAATISASLCYFICGCFLGWTSPSIPLLKDAARSPVGAIDSTQASWIVTSLMLGCLAGALPAGWLADWLGRKAILLMAAALFVVGWVLTLCAAAVPTLYIARLVAGAGVGACYAALPMYVGEVAHPRVRGALGAVMQLMHNAGSLFQNCVGSFVSYRALAAVDLAVPLVFAASFALAPESPYFLLARRRPRRAEAELMRLRGAVSPGAVAGELRAMARAVDADGARPAASRELVGSPGNRRALAVVLGLVFLQQVSGIFVILSYSTEIFRESGSSFGAEASSILLGVVQTGTVAVSILVADVAGRRVLLLVSVTGSAAALFAEGLYFYLKKEVRADMAAVDWLPVTALVVFLVAYSLGLGPLPMTVLGELFPTNVKGLAATYTSLWLVIIASGVGRLYQVVNDSCGIHVTFWGFSACCVGGIIFVIALVPETKGKTLTEILQELHKGKYISDELDTDETKDAKENESPLL